MNAPYLRTSPLSEKAGPQPEPRSATSHELKEFWSDFELRVGVFAIDGLKEDAEAVAHLKHGHKSHAARVAKNVCVKDANLLAALAAGSRHRLRHIHFRHQRRPLDHPDLSPPAVSRRVIPLALRSEPQSQRGLQGQPLHALLGAEV